MKKTFLHGILSGCYFKSFFILCLIFPVLVQAQESTGTEKKLHFGVKVGSTISSFTNQQPHTSVAIGLAGGVTAAYSFNSNMALQLELFYAQEGGRLLNIDIPSFLGQDYWYIEKVENQRVVINTLNVPLIFKYKIPLGSSGLSIFVGPNFGYNISAAAHKEVTVLTEVSSFHTYTASEDISSNIEKYSIDAIGGIGFEIPVGNYILSVEGSYKYGITPVYKSYSYVGIPQITGDLKCNTVNITLGLAF